MMTKDGMNGGKVYSLVALSLRSKRMWHVFG
jgi:hypothetical protein